jgi:hypothetical protein
MALIQTSRRRFLAGLFCAPAIIPVARLMRLAPQPRMFERGSYAGEFTMSRGAITAVTITCAGAVYSTPPSIQVYGFSPLLSLFDDLPERP